jgi:hypothetical protein
MYVMKFLICGVTYLLIMDNPEAVDVFLGCKTLAQSLGERMEASYTDFRKLQEQTVDIESRWEERCKKLEDDLQIFTEEEST